MADMRAFLEDEPNRAGPLLMNRKGHLRVADLERSIFGRSVATQVPGLGTGVAYTAEDAVGLPATIPVPKAGIIMAATVIDTDDNEVNMNLLVFDSTISTPTDNAAFVLLVADYSKLVGPPILISTFAPISGDVIGSSSNVNMPYKADSGFLQVQVVTTGSPNFATGTGLWLSFQIWTRETMA